MENQEVKLELEKVKEKNIHLNQTIENLQGVF